MPTSGPPRPATPLPAPAGAPTRAAVPTPATPVGGPSGPDGAAHPTPPSVPAGAPPAPGPTSYVIAAGDNLWSVAAARLAGVSGRPAAAVPDAEVTPYWQRLCDLNQPRLRSGDPSLVYPGEQIELPPVAA